MSFAFGPQPDGHGGFSYANGSRLYYANLTSNFNTVRQDFTFKGFEAIGVSRTDDVRAAAAGEKDAWMAPVIASKQNSRLFSDHEQIWADNAETSPYFGNVYVCFAAFRGQEKGNALPNPITVARSSDGGDTCGKGTCDKGAGASQEAASRSEGDVQRGSEDGELTEAARAAGRG